MVGIYSELENSLQFIGIFEAAILRRKLSFFEIWFLNCEKFEKRFKEIQLETCLKTIQTIYTKAKRIVHIEHKKLFDLLFVAFFENF